MSEFSLKMIFVQRSIKSDVCSLSSDVLAAFRMEE